MFSKLFYLTRKGNGNWARIRAVTLANMDENPQASVTSNNLHKITYRDYCPQKINVDKLGKPP